MKSRKNRFRAFTIVEMAVVMSIIAIIVTIVSVVYINSVSQAVDSSVVSDANTVYSAEQAYAFNKNINGKAWNSKNGIDVDLNTSVSSGTVADVVANTTGYCIRVYNPQSVQYKTIYSAYTINSTSGICNTLAPSVAAVGITSSGLVMNLDAGIAASYPGSGANWTDIQSNIVFNNNGTAPTYVYGTPSYFSFNGSSTMFIAPESSLLNTQTPTVEVWVKTNALSQNGFFFEKGQVNTQYSLFQEGTTVLWRNYLNAASGNIGASSNYLSVSAWRHVVGTYVSGTRCLYINGSLVSSDAATGTVGTNTNGMSVGVYGGYNGARAYYFNGSISIVRVYNRALSSTEVLANYNASRIAFGQ